MEQTEQIGPVLREWRRRRRLSQLDLALTAEISARHMSFIETGRSRPSREVILRLAEGLGLNLRNRNALLMAGGYAPTNAERRFDDPALAVDRHWNLVAHNASVATLMSTAAPQLLERPINVLRLSLHPDGLAGQIANLAEWKRHLIERLHHQVEASGDEQLEALAEELKAYPAPASSGPPSDVSAIAVPLLFDSPLGRLSFLSTTTMFGTPVEVTLSEIAIETFFPADAETAERLRTLAGAL